MPLWVWALASRSRSLQASPAPPTLARHVPEAGMIGEAGVDGSDRAAGRLKGDEGVQREPAVGVGNLGAHGASNKDDWLEWRLAYLRTTQRRCAITPGSTALSVLGAGWTFAG
jgi:hypothetical protein